MDMDLILITMLVSSLLKIKPSYSDFHLIHHMYWNRKTGFFGAFKHNFLKEFAKFTVQYPGVSITKKQVSFIFTRTYEISCKMETVIILDNRYLAN